MAERVGNYELLAVVARGGMGVVHRARDTRTGETVALKRMHDALAADDEIRRLFQRESRVGLRLRHPNLARTREVGEADGVPFVVMDYLDGADLFAWLRDAHARHTRIAPPIVVRVVLDLLEGLHALHEVTDDAGTPLGLVHRDVSPHNVVVGRDGIARLVDFGLAKALQGTRLTDAAVLRGKLGYLAPEATRGEVSRASDMFSAGVVLWEALTARRLFDKARRESGDAAAAIVAPSSVVPELPSAIDRVVLQALAPSPDARFATARAFGEALAHACAPAERAAVVAHATALAGRSDARGTGGAPAETAVPEPPGPPAASGESDGRPVKVRGGRSSDARRLLAVAALAVGGTTAITFAAVRAPRQAGAPSPSVTNGGNAPSAPAPPESAHDPTATVAASALPPTPPPLARSTAAPEAPARSGLDAARAPKATAATTVAKKTPPSAPGAASSVGFDDRACAVPYTIAPDGTRRFRPECIR